MVQISCPPYRAFPNPPSFFLGFLPLILFRLRNIKHCYVVSTISPASHPFSRTPTFRSSVSCLDVREPLSGLAPAHVPGLLRSPLEIENFLAIYAERLNCTWLALAYWGKCCLKLPKAALNLLTLSRSKSSYSVYVNVWLNHLKQ